MAEKRVVLTGAAGNIGSKVLPLLLNDPEIAHVWGIDSVRLQIPPHPKLTPLEKDVRDSDVHRFFQDTDCLVHLAFVVKNIHDDATTKAVNIGGMENLLGACETHSVKKIVFTSSAAVYGSGLDNPMRMQEDAPLRPDPDHVYSVCKVAVESRLQQFQKTNPGVILCILRPVLVVGPGVKNTYANLLQKRYFLTVKGFDPIVQAVHVTDMAYAVYLAVKRDLPGVFNIGPKDSLQLSEVCSVFHICRVQIPRPLFAFLVRLLYGLHLSSIPPKSISRFLHPPTVDASRFRDLFQWQPRYSTLESIAQQRSEGQ